jgi:hypothetical protein
VNKRLGWNAAADQAGATQPLLLDKHSIEAELAAADCGNVTTGPPPMTRTLVLIVCITHDP